MCRRLFSGKLLKRYETSLMKDFLVITRSDAFLHGADLFRLLIVMITTICLCSISNAIEIKGMSYIAFPSVVCNIPEFYKLTGRNTPTCCRTTILV